MIETTKKDTERLDALIGDKLDEIQAMGTAIPFESLRSLVRSSARNEMDRSRSATTKAARKLLEEARALCAEWSDAYFAACLRGIGLQTMFDRGGSVLWFFPWLEELDETEPEKEKGDPA